MKHFALLLLVAATVLSGCKDKAYRKYTANCPVYMDYASFRSSVAFEGTHAISTKGNIYLKDQYLFIVEPEKGIHFIDNSNPSSPQQLGFLKVLGCTGMSIRDHYLYANSYIDLVVIDIASISHPVEAGRVENVFPLALPSLDSKLPIASIDKNQGVVVGWETKAVKEEIQLNNYPVWSNCPACESLSSNVPLGSGNNGISSSGISGSITKFTILNQHLYVVDQFRLLPMNISNPTQPVVANAINLSRQVETLFPNGQHLFMGTTTGMVIYSADNPDAPTEISIITHVTGCDPVVVQGNYAYVTIRTGTTCAGNINELEVIDISNPAMPVTVSSFAMVNPHGLGIDGDHLFICDGTAGLKLFDASNPSSSGNNLVQQFGDIQATDVIPHNNTAIVIGDNGLYQYDYSNPNSLQLLSTILFH